MTDVRTPLPGKVYLFGRKPKEEPMTCIKKLTALLVSAALALSLLAGCGGSKALSQVIADLLSGMYNNVTVEVDPALTAALKKASAAGSTREEVLAALVEELNLSGVRLTLRQLQEGRQGDRGVELVFQSGADPDAAARSAVNGWASAFGALPDDGSYRAHVSMIEAEGGYYIAVDVEVLKAGTPDKDDPEPKPDDGIVRVGTAEQLQAVAARVNAGESDLDIQLTADIDLDGQSWTPIGTDWEHAYTGTFDGGDCTISGLSVSSSDEYVGLFGYIGEKGKVQNLTLDSSTITGTGFAGAVAGVNDGGTIENCHVVAGTVTNQIGSGIVGGVVGSNNGGTVTACSATGAVTASNDDAGGVVGVNTRGGKVIACYSTGSVTANGDASAAGGVVGVNHGTVTACYATGTVTVTGGSAGGVVGNNYGGTVTACYSTGAVTGTGRSEAGGVAGWNNGTVTACYWSGTGPTYGIGDPESDINATKVDGSTTTWSAATTAMNDAIPDATGWWYVPNGDSAPTKFTQTKPVPSTTP